MIIRETKDAALIASLNRHVQDVHVKMNPAHFKPFEQEPIQHFFESLIEKPNHKMLVAEDEGEPVGYAWIEIKHFPENAFKHAYDMLMIHQISINSTKRNMGYGTRMLEHIDELARERGINKVELDYWNDNTKAKRFYEKNGFVIYREYVFREVN
ncbi:GNAT family N-acetyltransferase [Fictibacillus aquaticus]|uniref:GNAT family N-acetyltransferase n=1 Tax=Fictibacillus aquaticus TaxID=2021314 RepID=A0A235FE23_9BACL|nr:GNAT family N-acetyltransferase [Fictibacillus aquaticus]OYD59462.1 GNAT family N-acetyltransferase [Fictibacillus aquaticus]